MNHKEKTKSAGPSAMWDREFAVLMTRAGAAHHAGKLDEAEALYRQILRRDPNSADAVHWLGVVIQQKGRNADALQFLRKSVAMRPQSADFVNNLGLAELMLGELDAAETSFGKALTINPNLAQAHYNLGLVFQKRWQLDAAISCFEKAIALVPNYANAILNLGNALSDIGRYDEAIATFRKLMDFPPAAQAARFNLAAAFKAARRYDEAAGVARQILEVDPKNVVAHSIMALLYWSSGRYDEGIAECRQAISLDPNYAEAHNTLGAIWAEQGRFDEARASFEASLAAQPDNADAIYGLATAAKASPEFAARVEALLHVPRPADKKVPIHFALGKIYDDLGNYDRAFENYRLGNELGRPKMWFNAGDWNAYIDRMIATITPAFFAERKPFGNASRRPVFIVGMPRSGTTLVEQILASHPKVTAAGEMGAINDLIRDLPVRLGPNRRNPECIAEIDQALAQQMAEKYLVAISTVDEAAARVTDKSTVNFLNLGVIALLFPNATIIHCRRDPMDTCLSCYFATFNFGHDYSYDLTTLGEYYVGYRRLMAHWRQVLPISLLDVDYEEVVANQEVMSRRIVAHCGLDWDERCLAFYKTERSVKTSSVWQVRQPIYKRSVKRWQNYERFLGPLRQALGTNLP